MPNLPLVGEVKGTTLGIIVVAGGGIAYYLYSRNKKAKAQQTQAGANQYGYGTGATGNYGYGSQYGYGSYTNAPYGYGLGSYGYGFGGGGFGGSNYFGYGFYGNPPPFNNINPTTNPQWSQAAVASLTAQGYSGQEVLGALGIYLTGGNLNDTQIGIVQAAIAAEGYPPTSGPGGFPPAWHSSGGGGGGGQGGGGGGGTTTKPNKPKLLTASQVGPGLINANWSVVPGATSYEFQVSPPDNAPHDIGDRTGYNAGDLSPGYHTVKVAAKNSAGTSAFATKRVNVKRQSTSTPSPVIPGRQE